jgi:hypothetical protein
MDENCLHDIVWAGLCAVCGKEITNNAGVPFSSVFVSEREAKRQQDETERRLLNSTKLGLVLDLDHTLLHATTEHFVKDLPKESDVFEFTLPPIITKYYLKLRYFSCFRRIFYLKRGKAWVTRISSRVT